MKFTVFHKQVVFNIHQAQLLSAFGRHGLDIHGETDGARDPSDPVAAGRDTPSSEAEISPCLEVL